jgi:uncharacterized protein YciI
MSSIGPIRREIVVDADPDLAFHVFTEQIGRWWPVAELSVHGEGSTVIFDSTEIVEVSEDGQRAVWGAVTEWRPGQQLAFTWHPGASADRASYVTVSFSAANDQTLVSLVHSGWEVFADPVAARAEYDHGWPEVLGRFAEHVTTNTSPPSDDAEDTWVALLHRPGPNAPHDGSLFAAPGFNAHVEFLTRMQDAGFLVAAGPLLDANGEGMTVLRLPGANRLDEAQHLATHEDASVTNGFFTVEVRPWQVMLQTAD